MFQVSVSVLRSPRTFIMFRVGPSQPVQSLVGQVCWRLALLTKREIIFQTFPTSWPRPLLWWTGWNYCEDTWGTRPSQTKYHQSWNFSLCICFVSLNYCFGKNKPNRQISKYQMNKTKGLHIFQLSLLVQILRWGCNWPRTTGLSKSCRLRKVFRDFSEKT